MSKIVQRGEPPLNDSFQAIYKQSISHYRTSIATESFPRDLKMELFVTMRVGLSCDSKIITRTQIGHKDRRIPFRVRPAAS